MPVALEGLEPLSRPVEVEFDALPVPDVPANPAEPSVEPLEPEPLPAEPTVEPLLDEAEPLPELELSPAVLPLDPEAEPGLFIALFSWIFPLASRQCVVGETALVLVAPVELLIEPEDPEPD
jgi:hypothetical protein